MSLNNNVHKICIDKETKIDFLKLLPIKKCLIKRLDASLIFVFCKNEQRIKIRLDHPDYGNFFVDLETMQIFNKCRITMSALFISVPV